MQTRKTRRRRAKASALAQWLLTLSIVGYPVAGLLATLMDLETTTTSVPLRAGVLLIALMLMARMPLRGPSFWRHHGWLAGFWAMYVLRLVWDVVGAGVPGAGEALFFFLAIVLLPSLALALAWNSGISEQALAWRIALVGGTACLLTTGMQFFELGTSKMLDLDATGGRLYFEAVNPITLGHTAVTTLIALLCLTRYRLGLTHLMVLAIMGAASVATLSLSASRGPFLALVMTLLVFGVITRRWRWMALMATVLAPLLLSSDSTIFERLAGGVEDESSVERLLIQGGAINQFFGSPLWGSAFVELQSLAYPHNLFIETAMALGIAGLAALVMVLAWSFLRAWRLGRRGQVLCGLLLLQYLLAAQVSGSLWGASSLWVLIAVCNAPTQPVARLKRRTQTMKLSTNPQ